MYIVAKFANKDFYKNVICQKRDIKELEKKYESYGMKLISIEKKKKMTKYDKLCNHNIV